MYVLLPIPIVNWNFANFEQINSSIRRGRQKTDGIGLARGAFRCYWCYLCSSLCAIYYCICFVDGIMGKVEKRFHRYLLYQDDIECLPWDHLVMYSWNYVESNASAPRHCQWLTEHKWVLNSHESYFIQFSKYLPRFERRKMSIWDTLAHKVWSHRENTCT